MNFFKILFCLSYVLDPTYRTTRNMFYTENNVQVLPQPGPLDTLVFDDITNISPLALRDTEHMGVTFFGKSQPRDEDGTLISTRSLKTYTVPVNTCLYAKDFNTFARIIWWPHANEPIIEVSPHATCFIEKQYLFIARSLQNAIKMTCSRIELPLKRNVSATCHTLTLIKTFYFYQVGGSPHLSGTAFHRNSESSHRFNIFD